MKKKVWDITVKDNPNRVVMGENDEFYTTDTEAYLVFNLEDKNFNPATAVLTLENRNDGSLKNETVDVVEGLIEWEMPQRYIEHFGNWQGQLVYEDTKDGQPELYTSAPFTFVVNAHIGDKKQPSLVEIENWEKFIRDGTELIETWEDMEDLRQANEAQRQANYQELLDTGVLQTNINTKLEALEEEYAPKLTEVTAQLAQTVKQGQNESITKAMLSQEIKNDLNNGEIDFRLNTSEIENGAVTSEKLNSDVGLFETVIPKFRFGYIDSLGAVDYQVKGHLMTDYFVPYNKGDTLVLLGGSDDIRMQYRRYDKHKNLIRSSPQYTQHLANREFTADTDGYIKIVVSVQNVSAITESMVDMLSNSVYLITNRLKTVEVPGGPEKKELITMEDIDKSVGLIETVHPTMTLGKVDGVTGEPYFTSSFIISADRIPIIEGEKLIFKGSSDPNKVLIVYLYDSDGEYVVYRGNFSQTENDREIDLKPHSYFRYSLHYDGEEEIDGTLFKELSEAVVHERYTLKALRNNNTRTVENVLDLNLEAHGIGRATGTIISNQGLTVLDDFTTEQRTGKYLRVAGSTNIELNFDNGRAYVFEYNNDFVFLGSTELNSNTGHELRTDTTMVKVSLEELTIDYPKAILTYQSEVGADRWVYNDNRTNRPNTDWEYTSFIYETSSNEGRSILNPNGTEEQRPTTRYFNSGVLMLPPNYDPQGEAVKLIIWCQGSGGFLTIDSHLIDNYNRQMKYLLDEGYAIFGAYRKTTKYGSLSQYNTGGYAMPTTISALISGYKHIIQNYNIAKDGVFVSGKSAGGFDANMLSYHTSIPVLATGLLAPTFEPLSPPYGSHGDARLTVAEDFGFEGDHSVLADQETSPVPKRTPELKQYMIDNAEKMIGYNPWWNGLIGEDVKELASDSFERVQFDYERNKNKLRLFPNPIKIWYAEDDDRAGIPVQIPLFAKQIQNTQGNIELRKMPIGTGGHGSVDSHPDSIKLPSVTTRLGKTHTDIPLAYAELVSYFRRFEN